MDLDFAAVAVTIVVAFMFFGPARFFSKPYRLPKCARVRVVNNKYRAFRTRV